MVQDVSALLQGGLGVLASRVHKENFSPARSKLAAAPEAREQAQTLPFRLPVKTAA
jgi:hypothetical protein